MAGGQLLMVGSIRLAGRRLRSFGRSRVFWFLLERLSSIGSGFALTAMLTRVVHVDQLADYLAAFAFVSLFEPLFGVAVGPYLMRMLRERGDPAERAVTMKSAFVLLQLVALLMAAVLVAVQFIGPDTHAFALIMFAQVALAPWKLFSVPLLAEDRFLDVVPVQVAANVTGGALRIAALLLTGDLALVAALLAFEPLVNGLVLSRRGGIWATGGRLLSRGPALQLLAALPSLSITVFLVTGFYRSPILLAQWGLEPIDVVHIAICTQIMTGLGTVQAALVQSQAGLIAKSSTADLRLSELLRIGSGVAFLYGAAVVTFVALIGNTLLVTLYGSKAEGAWVIACFLSFLSPLNGFAQLVRLAVNFRGWPRHLLIMWVSVWAMQAVFAVSAMLARSPEVLAAGMPLSLLFGMCCLAAFVPSLRRFVRDALTGFAGLFHSRAQWTGLYAVMLTHRPPHAEGARS